MVKTATTSGAARPDEVEYSVLDQGGAVGLQFSRQGATTPSFSVILARHKTEITVLWNRRYAGWATIVFIASIFYGDLWIGLTIPICVLVMPVLATVGPADFRRIPRGFFLLMGLVLIVAVQAGLGESPKGKQDLTVYLPLLYAAAAMISLRNITLRPHAMKNALVAGGILTSITMLLVALILPTGRFLIPGQAFYATEEAHTTEQALRERLLAGTATLEEGLRLYTLMTERGEAFPLAWEERVLILGVNAHPERLDLLNRLREVLAAQGKAAELAEIESKQAGEEAHTTEQALRERLLAGTATLEEGLRLYTLMTERGEAFPLAWEERVLILGVNAHPERLDLLNRLRKVLAAQGKATELAEISAEQAKTTARRRLNKRPDAEETEFYLAKSVYRNALGVSNYIAVFLVFVGTVCLFSGARYLAGLFGLIAVITLSRFAIVYVVIATIAWLVKRRFGVTAALVFIALASAAGVLLMTSIHDMAHTPTSLGIRVSYWLSGLEAIRSDPLTGQPRSYILSLLDVSLLWNPHNIVLTYGAYFGIIGLLIYLAYLFVALRAIWRRARQSHVWMGVLFGLAIMLGWANFEVVAFTPAFEILLSSLYVMALNDERSPIRTQHCTSTGRGSNESRAWGSNDAGERIGRM